ncbi:hypothetical protein GCM10009839_07540 [Catenulispora yoronensis]|uniref:Uncharacterized protein n=2 Tax=Catenulispora yoronensis TaxID=450799 RepID=A0ABP5F4J7_9ACTN
MSEPEAGPEGKSESEFGFEPGLEAGLEAKAEPEAGFEAKAGSGAEAKAEPELKTERKASSEPAAGTEGQSKSEPGFEAQPEAAAEAEPKAEAGPELGSGSESGSELPPPPKCDTPLPRRVPSSNSARVPRVARPAEQTVRHLLDVLKHLP